MPLATSVIAGGIALALTYANYTAMDQKSKLSELANQKKYLTETNTNALTVAAALFGSGKTGIVGADGFGVATAGTPAPVYPPVYYPPNGQECEQTTGHINPTDANSSTIQHPASSATSTSLWSVGGQSITVRGNTLADLKNSNQAAVFQNLKNGAATPNGGQSSTMPVIGYNCDVSGQILSAKLLSNTTPTSGALDAAINKASGKAQSLLAEVPVSVPPLSDCVPYVTDDAANDHVPPANSSGKYNLGTISTSGLQLKVNCNNVVALLRAQEQGSSTLLFESGPLLNGVPTPANSVDATYKPMGVSGTLAPGAHNIIITATQPNNATVQFSLGVTVNPSLPPENCRGSCRDMPGGVVYMNEWQHNPCYEAHNSCGWGWPVIAETCWICYQPTFQDQTQVNAYHLALSQGQDVTSADYTGLNGAFDPNNNCAYTISAHRGIDYEGCFVGKTKIQMGDGSFKRADAIHEGDEVYSPIVGHNVKVNKVIAGPEMGDLLDISISQRTVEVSQDHTFMTALGPVAAHTLAAGDLVLDVDGAYHAITAIRAVKHATPVTVWNYVLDGGFDERAHLLVGDGLLSGDIVLQNHPVDRKLLTEAFEPTR